MNKSMANHFMMTVIFFGFTLLGSTELLAVDLMDFILSRLRSL